jgi:hypothetical protein
MSDCSDFFLTGLRRKMGLQRADQKIVRTKLDSLKLSKPSKSWSWKIFTKRRAG